MAKHGRHEVLADASIKVVGIVLPNGKCPIGEWLETLNSKQYAAAMNRIEIFAERGYLKSPQSFNNLAKREGAKVRVDEIKHVGANLRIYVADYSKGASLAWVTHGSTKPLPKAVKRMIEQARRIYEERA